MMKMIQDHGKQNKWTLPGLKEEEQKMVEWIMESHTQRQEKKAAITQENIMGLVACSALRRALHNTGVSPADAAWAWIADQKGSGRIPAGIYKRVQGPYEVAEPYWEGAVQLRVDWNGIRDGGITQEYITVVQRTSRVERALRQHIGVTSRYWGGDESSSDSEEEEAAPEGSTAMTKEVLDVTKEAVDGAWQSVKGHFKGEGGRAQFWLCVGLLMMQGRIQGEVGWGPREGKWWETAAALGQKLGSKLVTQRPLPAAPILGQKKSASHGTVEVAVDLMSYAQSARHQLEARGVHYVPMDKIEWVFSALDRVWVQNIVCDVLIDSPD